MPDINTRERQANNGIRYWDDPGEEGVNENDDAAICHFRAVRALLVAFSGSRHRVTPDRYSDDDNDDGPLWSFLVVVGIRSIVMDRSALLPILISQETPLYHTIPFHK